MRCVWDGGLRVAFWGRGVSPVRAAPLCTFSRLVRGAVSTAPTAAAATTTAVAATTTAAAATTTAAAAAAVAVIVLFVDDDSSGRSGDGHLERERPTDTAPPALA